MVVFFTEHRAGYVCGPRIVEENGLVLPRESHNDVAPDDAERPR
jgi:hypothetical protein